MRAPLVRPAVFDPMSEPNLPASPRRAALVFIFITVLLDMLAVGVIVPVLPKFVCIAAIRRAPPWSAEAREFAVR